MQIVIKESEKLYEGVSAFVSFDYDFRVIGALRQLETRYYNPQTRIWEIPYKYIPQLLKRLPGLEVEIVIEVLPGASKTEQIDMDILAGFTPKTNPYKHQLEGVAYGINKDCWLLGDGMGLGKSWQAINLAVLRKQRKEVKHCLIVCGVNSVVHNWKKEIEVHSDETPFILGSRVNRKGRLVVDGSAKKIEHLEMITNGMFKHFFTITNIESLRNKEIVEKITHMCKKGIIDMIVVDEFHTCKNPQSQQAKGLMKLLPKYRLAMTGTPIMNNPIESFTALKWLGYESHSFYQFKNHYCTLGGYGGYEVVGYKNLEEIRSKFNAIMLRRLKEQVLDLPPKVRMVETVEMSTKQQKVYDAICGEVKMQLDMIKLDPNPLSRLTRLRQSTACPSLLASEVKDNAKLERLLEIVEEVVSSGGKLVVFSGFKEVIKAILPEVQKKIKEIDKSFDCCIITGDTVDRQQEVDNFQNESKYKVCLGTTQAAGTGLTLTAAETLVFMDKMWSPALNNQAEDRIYRIGTKSSVNIITLVCKDTIDEKIEGVLAKKQSMSDYLVDNKELSRSEIMDLLLDF